MARRATTTKRKTVAHVTFSPQGGRQAGSTVGASGDDYQDTPASSGLSRRSSPDVPQSSSLTDSLADTLALLREHHRQREDFHRAEKRLINQVKAIQRRAAFSADRARCSQDEAELKRDVRAEHSGEEQNQGDSSEFENKRFPRQEPETADRDHHARSRQGEHEEQFPGPVSGSASESFSELSATPTPTDLAFVKFASGPLEQARDFLRRFRLYHESIMVSIARRLPAYEWILSVPGLGPLGLAQIAAEAGDLANYPDVGRLWKRMGLAVIGGEAQRRCRDVDKALLHAFNPRRRAIMHAIGDSLLKGNFVGPRMKKRLDAFGERIPFTDEEKKLRDLGSGEYRKLYLARKQQDEQAHPDFAQAHIHRRAMRYMEKKMLRDLRRHWRAELRDASSKNPQEEDV